MDLLTSAAAVLMLSCANLRRTADYRLGQEQPLHRLLRAAVLACEAIQSKHCACRLAIFGGLIEILQSFTTYRLAEYRLP